jgi:hypothetical protein
MTSSTAFSEINDDGISENAKTTTRRRQRSEATRQTTTTTMPSSWWWNDRTNNIRSDGSSSSYRRYNDDDADDHNDHGSQAAARHGDARWQQVIRAIFMLALVATALSPFWFHTELLPLKDIRALQEENERSLASVQLFPSSSIRIKHFGRVKQQQQQQQPQSYNRTPLTWDEFLLKTPSELEVENYFQFNPPPANSQIGRLEPLWTCRNNVTPRHKKLVYLHMSRSASSTLRALFRGYAHYCNAGIAIVTQCVHLATPFMQGNDVWANGAYSSHVEEPCKLVTLMDRQGNDFPTNWSSTVSTQLLQEHEIDILTGHVPLGSDLYWTRQQQQQEEQQQQQYAADQHVDSQYVVFFRHPLHKFVSEVLVFNHSYCCETIDDSVASIRNIVSSQLLELGAYRDKFTRYLITPQQHQWLYSRGISLANVERRVNLTLSNLVNNNVLVGIVENMPASIQLLRYILDGDHQINQLFHFFSDSEKIDQSVNGGQMAISNQKTTAVVAAIRQNATLLEMVNEYLKYEYRIYKYALMIHKRQDEWLSSLQEIDRLKG